METLDFGRLMRTVLMTLGGCVGFFGVWTLCELYGLLPAMSEGGAALSAVARRVAVAGPSALVGVGVCFVAGRYCWPLDADADDDADREAAW